MSASYLPLAAWLKGEDCADAGSRAEITITTGQYFSGLYDVPLCHKNRAGTDGNEIILIVIQLDPGHHNLVSRF